VGSVVGLAVEFGQLGPEVRAHVTHGLLQTVQVTSGEHRMPVLGDEKAKRAYRNLKK
jgi:hypothetical protein